MWWQIMVEETQKWMKHFAHLVCEEERACEPVVDSQIDKPWVLGLELLHLKCTKVLWQACESRMGKDKEHPGGVL